MRTLTGETYVWGGIVSEQRGLEGPPNGERSGETHRTARDSQAFCDSDCVHAHTDTHREYSVVHSRRLSTVDVNSISNATLGRHSSLLLACSQIDVYCVPPCFSHCDAWCHATGGAGTRHATRSPVA